MLGRSLAVPVLLASLLAACSPSLSVRVEATPAAAVLNLGGSATFTVTIAAATAAGPFTLDTGTLPAGVTASFSDATLGAAGDASDLTLSAAADATVGTFTVTVTATGTAASSSTAVEVTIEALTVTGRVTGYVGQPLPGVSVLVGDHPVTTTASDGTFTVEGVVVPYDVAIYDTVERWAEVFEGLTVGALELVPLASTSSSKNLATATVSGELSPAVPAGHRVTLCLEGVGMVVYGCTTAVPADTTYSIAAIWAGGVDAEARLRAIEYSVDADLDPVEVTGSGAATPFGLTEGGTADVDVAIGGTVPTASFDVAIAAPFTVADYFVNLVTVLPSGQTFSTPPFGDAASPVTAFTPAYAGSTYALAVQAIGADGRIALGYRSGLTSGGSQSFTLSQAPTMVAPVDAATGVGTGTEFSITGTAGRVNHFLFSGADFSYVVTTGSETARIPDLAAQGLPLPPAENMTWTVLNSPDRLDVDDAATDGGVARGYLDLVLLANAAGPPPSGPVNLNTAGARAFTTAP